MSLVRDTTPRKRFLTPAVVFLVAAYWIAWVLGLVAQSLLRGVGDEVFAPTNLRSLEAATFFVVPPEWLQTHIQSRDWIALDFFGFMNHVLWFPLPQVMAIALTRKATIKLAEFFTWVVTLALVSGLIFLVFPVIPPWMEGGSTRVLVERAFTDYTKVDNNPVAAFPSMHAAVPFLIGIFFWKRCPEDGRPLAWLGFGYAFTVGFSVVYLGEHWLLDVVAGYVVAGLVAWAFLSGGFRRVSRVIPGDPVGGIIALNNRVLAPPPQPVPQSERGADDVPETLPRAA